MNALHGAIWVAVASTFSTLGHGGGVGQVISFPEITVDKSSVNDFSTPVAYYNGTVYTVNVEPPKTGPGNALNLQTIIRKAIPSGTNEWVWQSTLLDGNTLEDPYHTQASIGVDPAGYIHVAYNMHNMPWQYAVSTRPGDVSAFSMHGDVITLADKMAVKLLNKTYFPSIGAAAIPGNQITYPAFFNDRSKSLYVTYRFATRPKRDFPNRGFAGGIARYDVSTKQWTALGGPVAITRQDADWPGNGRQATVKPFAYTDEWTVYHIQLAFDANNGMHACWMWRKGGPGPDTSNPSYAFSTNQGESFSRPNGNIYTLPIDVGSAEVVETIQLGKKYLAPTSIAVDQFNVPHILLMSPTGPRYIVNYDKAKNRWSTPEASPFGATVIQFDGNGDQWAFATGLTVLRRKHGAPEWKVVYREPGNTQWGWPRVVRSDRDHKFIVHTQSLDLARVKIIQIDWNMF